MFTHAFGLVGAQHTVFKFNLQPNKTEALNFCTYGVPNGARILAVNYTPSGPLFPLQWHSNQLIENQPFWSGHGTSHEVELWPASPTGEQIETEVSCMVTWVVSAPDDPLMINLVEAFAAYVNKRYVDAVIPANVAVESRMVRVLDTYLRRFVGREHVEKFLTDAATYSSQLNVVLPVLASLNNCPIMPVVVRGNLNRLRGLRNDLAHHGRLDKPLEKDETAELLAAATFGAAYINFFERTVAA